MLKIDSGESVLEAALDPDHVASLRRIYVLRSLNHYVLLANTRFQERNPFSTNTINNQPIVHGHAFGFDRRSGRKLWDTKLASHGIKLDQPQELPVLVFTSRRSAKDDNNRITKAPRYLISILDKRTGDFVYEEATRESFITYSYSVDPKSNRISVNFADSAIDLAFADDTPPAEKRSKPDKKSGVPNSDESR